MPPRITSIAVAQPPHWIEQSEAALSIGAATGDARRAASLARGSQIRRRAIALPGAEVAALGSIESRNRVYSELAPALAVEASANALRCHVTPASIGAVVASSCTGYMVPGWDVTLVQELSLCPELRRLPVTQAGCAGGVLALAQATDFVRLHPDRASLAVAVELCSLAFHARAGDPGNLTSALIFGDGAGAALIEDSGEAGLELVDAASTLVPCSREALGFDLTDRGFYPLLTRELAGLLPQPTLGAARGLLRRHGLSLDDLAFCLVHPGGPRILSALEAAFGMERGAFCWSWRSLQELGNTSSAAIFDVIRRFLEDPLAPRGWGLAMAFGPGVSIELLLLRC